MTAPSDACPPAPPVDAVAAAGTALTEDDLAAAVALASLPGAGPMRLRRLLDGRRPVEAWEEVAAGGGAALIRPDDSVEVTAAAARTAQVLANQWAAAARRLRPAELLAGCRAAGIAVDVLGWPGYPGLLAADVHPPAVLFSRGDLGALARPRVAIVGTRRCTPAGRDIATELGLGLARAGVAVVSGLALGVDGAAHQGALAVADGGPCVGVVGSGLDVVYPAKHRRLWEEVATRGLLLSENPPGGRPEAWRFPARNRILAALAEAVVVVESRAAGGSMLTVEEALRRDVAVLAVPGSVRNPAANGCNELLSSGAVPARDVDDVLVAIGLGGTAATAPRRRKRRGADEDGSPASAADRELIAHGELTSEQKQLLAAVGHGESAVTDTLLGRTGIAPGRAAVALAGLEDAGLLVRDGGWWRRP